jgi:hypothetical protein
VERFQSFLVSLPGPDRRQRPARADDLAFRPDGVERGPVQQALVADPRPDGDRHRSLAAVGRPPERGRRAVGSLARLGVEIARGGEAGDGLADEFPGFALEDDHAAVAGRDDFARRVEQQLGPVSPANVRGCPFECRRLPGHGCCLDTVSSDTNYLLVSGRLDSARKRQATTARVTRPFARSR